MLKLENDYSESSVAAYEAYIASRGMLRIDNLEKKFGSHVALQIKEFVVMKGESVAIVGGSGAGKTTLGNIISGLVKKDSGSMFIYGNVGMVFQKFGLFENHTAIDNVILPQVHVLKRSRIDATLKAYELLGEVGMLSHMGKYPSELSGGQQQRIAIARTLAMNPDLLILDEPTASLDIENIKSSAQNLESLNKSGTTMITITHDLAFARYVASRIIFMSNGKILEDRKTNDFFNNPQTVEARQFLNSVLL